MRKIAVVTGNRSDYGLLEPLIIRMQTANLSVHVIVLGSHLSPFHGFTMHHIVASNIIQVENMLASDTANGTCKSIGLAISGIADVLNNLCPELVIVLGDRTETFAAALAAHICRIPIAHIHGGELTSGAFDDALRHGITHMATYHFTATPAYQKRVIALLKATNRPVDKVWNVGALGLDGIEKYKKPYNPDGKPLIVFHPATMEPIENTISQLRNVLIALNERSHYYNCIVANCDPAGARLNETMRQYCIKGNVHVSLPRHDFLRMLADASVIIGNSSAGIIEAPALCTPTINIGRRQLGRLTGQSIFYSNGTKEDILSTLNRIAKADLYFDNLYGNGTAAEQIIRHLPCG